MPPLANDKNGAGARQRLPLHWPTVRQLFAVEMRMFLRDKRTVFWAVVLPLILMPAIFFLMGWTQRQREERIEALTFRYAVLGSQAEMARELIQEGKAAEDAATAAAAEKPQEPAGALLPKAVPLQLEEVPVADPRAALEKEELHFLIETYSAAEVAEKKIAVAPPLPKEAAGEDAAAASRRKEEPPAPLPLLRVVFAGGWDYSQTAATSIQKILDRALELRRTRALAEAGFAVDREDILPIGEERDLASAGQRAGLLLGKFALLWVLSFLIAGGSVIAADTIAGEKERGSLETLLTSAASRIDIVTAKMLLILAVGLAVTLLQILNFGIYAGLDLIDLPASLAVDLSPAAFFWLILMLLPLAALVAGILLLVSAYSKTYKDFQQKFFPVSLLLFGPTLVSALPAIELRSAIVLVPLANLSVGLREVLVGKIDWLMLPLAFLVSSAFAVFLLRKALDALSAERLITAAEADVADFEGGPALFPRHVLRIFAVMWVVLFLVSGSVPFFAESIERQLMFNFGVVFLGGSFFSIWRYRLDYREAFALRPVRPIAWLAVLVGAPSFLITGIAVAKLSEKLLPVPREVIEAFGKALIPADYSTWQMLLMLAILPGIVEELTFRGVLLHGLKKRFHPVALALVVGVVFSLFHFALFRLVPTAILGTGLSAVTLLTGSVFPAMLWHAINNSLALFAGISGIDMMSLDGWVYGLAALLTALSFWILWRTRTPLPGLRRGPRQPG